MFECPQRRHRSLLTLIIATTAAATAACSPSDPQPPQPPTNPGTPDRDAAPGSPNIDAAAPQADATPAEPAWVLVWSDEFLGDAIDTSKWSHEVNCWGGGNNEQQCYTDRPENSFVRDGVLHIHAQREDFTGPSESEDSPNYDPGDTRTLPYTSARLRTRGQGDFTYARVEVRAKLPAGQGTWPAIWMLPTDSTYGVWAASGEIDIMEAVNLKAASDAPGAPAGALEGRVHGTLHYGEAWPGNSYSGSEYQLPDDANPADDFHVYELEWERGEIRWYVDGTLYATQTQDDWYTRYRVPDGSFVTGPDDAPFNQRFHLLLNLAVGGDWAANVNETGIDETAFPTQLLIDYVRVYECSADPMTGAGCTK